MSAAVPERDLDTQQDRPIGFEEFKDRLLKLLNEQIYHTGYWIEVKEMGVGPFDEGIVVDCFLVPEGKTVDDLTGFDESTKTRDQLRGIFGIGENHKVPITPPPLLTACFVSPDEVYLGIAGFGKGLNMSRKTEDQVLTEIKERIADDGLDRDKSY